MCVCVCYSSVAEMVLVALMAEGDAGISDGQKSDKTETVIDDASSISGQKIKQTNETERRKGRERLGETKNEK